MVEFEVLGDFVLVDDLAHPQPDGVLAGELVRVHAGLDLREVDLGGRQQRLALVRT